MTNGTNLSWVYEIVLEVPGDVRSRCVGISGGPAASPAAGTNAGVRVPGARNTRTRGRRGRRPSNVGVLSR
jgi:hypothetical protein